MADQKLDGSDVIKPVPFDAHEQIVRQQHDYSKEEGYKVAEPVALVQGEKAGIAKNEYPKAVAHNDERTEPVIARDEDHEDELAAAAEDAEEAKPKAKEKS